MVTASQDAKGRPTAAQLEHHKLVANFRNKGTIPVLNNLIRVAKNFLAAKAAAAADTISSLATTVQCAYFRAVHASSFETKHSISLFFGYQIGLKSFEWNKCMRCLGDLNGNLIQDSVTDTTTCYYEPSHN